MDNKPPKPKTPQAQNMEQVSERDAFQTPNYATDLLIPFLTDIAPMSPSKKFVVWECAAGLGKIANRLMWDGFDVISTDLSYEGGMKMNFLTDIMSFPFDVIATNPPFSLKVKFYKKCLEYGKPFALLIPADYSKWTIEAVEKDGCEKIIPNRRIDYITPNILQRIHVGELFEFIKEKDSLKKSVTLREYSTWYPSMWRSYLVEFEDYKLFNSIYDAPAELLRKYSSSYYHSMWLTRGFNIGRTETFVELSNEDKFNI